MVSTGSRQIASTSSSSNSSNDELYFTSAAWLKIIDFDEEIDLIELVELTEGKVDAEANEVNEPELLTILISDL